ncbi:MAG: NADH-quinone oxidoreductase subunit H [Candidatus Thorarchaeota archaeon]
MIVPWFEILIFPGFLFVLGLTLLFEQIASRLYSRFDYKNKSQPFFIPLVDHFKLCFRGEVEKITFRNILQGILLIFLFTLSLFASMILPFGIIGRFPDRIGDYGTNVGRFTGVMGIINFEGDLFLLLIILLFAGITVFGIYWLSFNHTNYEALKIALTFMVFDIPLILAIAGPALTKNSTSLSLIAEDIRTITYFNRGFGILLLIPLGLVISIVTLSYKFDQPHFDRLNSNKNLIEKAPFPENWKKHIWNISMRILEFVLAGVIVSIFLGGAYFPIPIIEGYEIFAHTLNYVFKTSIVMLLITVLKALTPRLKSSQLTNLALKILSPFAVVYVMIIGGYIAIFGIN